MEDGHRTSTHTVRAALIQIDGHWFLETASGVRSCVTPENCDPEALLGVAAEWEMKERGRGKHTAVPAAAHLRIESTDANGARSKPSSPANHDSEDLTQPARTVTHVDATDKGTGRLRVCSECRKRLPMDAFPNPNRRKCRNCGGQPRQRSVWTESGGLPGSGKRG
jgi:hypothetical protein